MLVYGKYLGEWFLNVLVSRSFYTLKNNWGLKPFVYVDFIYWYHIWNENWKNYTSIPINFKIMTSPLNVNTNNIFLWKVTIYFKTITTTTKKVVRRVALFYMFSHLFTEWPSRSQTDSYICLSIQFVVILLWLKKVKKILPHKDM